MKTVPVARRRSGADLHVHTTHSDGVCSPCEVVSAAAGVGLAALAITDHDTVSALAIAGPVAARLGVELVPGVELTCVQDDRELHLLGYFFDAGNLDLGQALTTLQAGRATRIPLMVQRLEQAGLRVDLAALSRAFPRAVLGRPHLAQYLVKTGQVASTREAFVRYLADGRPACVARSRLDVYEAIGLVRAAGGVTGLAHPPFNLRWETLRALASANLGAIEVVGPGIANRLSKRFRDWAQELGLVPIAGSDFHQADRPGRWVGAITTPDADLERLRRARP